MINKKSGAFVSLGSLFTVLVLLGFVGCSLETSDLSRAPLAKRTYVRASLQPLAARVPAKHNLKRPVTYLGMAAAMPAPRRRLAPSSVVKLPNRQDFKRYAVAYGKRNAIVHDRSIIPFALKLKKKPSNRFALPIFRKNTTTSKSRRPSKSRLQQLLESRPSIRVRTTAYTHNEWDHVKYGRKSAMGTRLRFGKVRSAAADWSRYPVGTQFRIVGQPGFLYEVDDYGGALVGTGTIDLYKPTFSAMNRWGVRHVNIEVVKWGSFARSLKVLKPRTKWSHVRRMVNSIRKKGSTEKARLTALVLHHSPKGSKALRKN